MKGEMCSNCAAEGVRCGWETDDDFKYMVMRNLAEGFPVLLFSGEPGDRILLATGYQKGGDVLLGWLFSAGRARQNMTFSSDKRKRFLAWNKNILAALLVQSKPEPPEDIRPLICRALERGAAFLRGDKKLEAFAKTFDGSADVHIHPEIWDLAERRCFLAYELKEAAGLFRTDALKDAIDACWKIHEHVWQIDERSKSKKGRTALKDAVIQKQIAEMLLACRSLDLIIADTISRFLEDEARTDKYSFEIGSP